MPAYGVRVRRARLMDGMCGSPARKALACYCVVATLPVYPRRRKVRSDNRYEAADRCPYASLPPPPRDSAGNSLTVPLPSRSLYFSLSSVLQQPSERRSETVRPSGWFGGCTRVVRYMYGSIMIVRHFPQTSQRSEARSGDAHATLAPKRRAKLRVAAGASGGADQFAETLRIRRYTVRYIYH